MLVLVSVCCIMTAIGLLCVISIEYKKDDVVHFHVDPNARMFLAAILQIVCCNVTKYHSFTWESFTRKSILILNATKMHREVGT